MTSHDSAGETAKIAPEGSESVERERTEQLLQLFNKEVGVGVIIPLKNREKLLGKAFHISVDVLKSTALQTLDFLQGIKEFPWEGVTRYFSKKEDLEKQVEVVILGQLLDKQRDPGGIDSTPSEETTTSSFGEYSELNLDSEDDAVSKKAVRFGQTTLGNFDSLVLDNDNLADFFQSISKQAFKFRDELGQISTKTDQRLRDIVFDKFCVVDSENQEIDEIYGPAVLDSRKMTSEVRREKLRELAQKKPFVIVILEGSTTLFANHKHFDGIPAAYILENFLKETKAETFDLINKGTISSKDLLTIAEEYLRIKDPTEFSPVSDAFQELLYQLRRSVSEETAKTISAQLYQDFRNGKISEETKQLVIGILDPLNSTAVSPEIFRTRMEEVDNMENDLVPDEEEYSVKTIELSEKFCLEFFQLYDVVAKRLVKAGLFMSAGDFLQLFTHKANQVDGKDIVGGTLGFSFNERKQLGHYEMKNVQEIFRILTDETQDINQIRRKMSITKGQENRLDRVNLYDEKNDNVEKVIEPLRRFLPKKYWKPINRVSKRHGIARAIAGQIMTSMVPHKMGEIDLGYGLGGPALTEYQDAAYTFSIQGDRIFVRRKFRKEKEKGSRE